MSLYERWWQDTVSIWIIGVYHQVTYKTLAGSPSHPNPSYFKHADLRLPYTLHHHPSASFCHHTHTHTHTATVQNMSGSIKHLNTRAVEQIAGIQQGRVGSKSWDRITSRWGGGCAGQVRRAELIFPLRIRVSSAWVWGYFSWHRAWDRHTGAEWWKDESRTKESKWGKVFIEEKAGWLRVKRKEG